MCPVDRADRWRGHTTSAVPYVCPVPQTYPYVAHRKVESMKTLIARDPEQEVRGVALPVVDSAIGAVKAAQPDDPVVQATSDLFSAKQIALGEGVRAADLLVVAQQLDAALGRRPPRSSSR